MFTSGEMEVERSRKGYETKKYKLLCLKQISNNNILYSIEKYSYYFSITLFFFFIYFY